MGVLTRKTPKSTPARVRAWGASPEPARALRAERRNPLKKTVTPREARPRDGDVEWQPVETLRASGGDTTTRV